MPQRPAWRRSGWSPFPYPFERRLKMRARNKTADLLRAAGLLDENTGENRSNASISGLAPAPANSALADPGTGDPLPSGVDVIVLFSPIVSLDRRSVFGLEAGVSDRGAISRVLQQNAPRPLTDRDVDRRLLEKACINAHRWTQIFGDAAPLLLVDISDREPSWSDMKSDVLRALEISELDPARLCITIAEAAIGLPASLAAINDLAEVGVRLGINGFSGDYNFISGLNEISICVLFIDRTMVADLLDEQIGDQSSPIEALTFVAEARRRGLPLAARGIGSSQDIDRLREMGIEFAQIAHLADGFDQDSVLGVIAEGLDTRPRPNRREDDTATDREK